MTTARPSDPHTGSSTRPTTGCTTRGGGLAQVGGEALRPRKGPGIGSRARGGLGDGGSHAFPARCVECRRRILARLLRLRRGHGHLLATSCGRFRSLLLARSGGDTHPGSAVRTRARGGSAAAVHRAQDLPRPPLHRASTRNNLRLRVGGHGNARRSVCPTCDTQFRWRNLPIEGERIPEGASPIPNRIKHPSEAAHAITGQ